MPKAVHGDAFACRRRACPGVFDRLRGLFVHGARGVGGLVQTIGGHGELDVFEFDQTGRREQGGVEVKLHGAFRNDVAADAMAPFRRAGPAENARPAADLFAVRVIEGHGEAGRMPVLLPLDDVRGPHPEIEFEMGVFRLEIKILRQAGVAGVQDDRLVHAVRVRYDAHDSVAFPADGLPFFVQFG